MRRPPALPDGQDGARSNLPVGGNQWKAHLQSGRGDHSSSGRSYFPHISRRAGANVVGLCDVDENNLAAAGRNFPQAKRYRDWRKMLEGQKDIDAVVVTIPDHSHAAAAMMAMKLGKHVYCQKPLTHDISEARALREAAQKYKVATQMGNEGHSSEALRRTVDWVRGGIIGAVRETHIWTNRPIWPQGIH